MGIVSRLAPKFKKHRMNPNTAAFVRTDRADDVDELTHKAPADHNELNHIRQLQAAEASTVCHNDNCETNCAQWPSCGSIVAKNEGLDAIGMCIEFMLRDQRHCCTVDDIMDGSKASLSAPCGAEEVSLMV